MTDKNNININSLIKKKWLPFLLKTQLVLFIRPSGNPIDEGFQQIISGRVQKSEIAKYIVSKI